MDISENILSILFLVFWAIIALVSRKKKRKGLPVSDSGGQTRKTARRDTQTSPQRTGERPPAADFFKNLRSGIESIAKELSTPGASESEISEKTIIKALEQRDRIAEKKASQTAAVSADGPAKKIVPLHDAPAVKGPPFTEPAYSVRAASISDLRKAVVWSEILGPAVSMRNE